MKNEDEWLTIAQAAQRLGIHERQARRYANHLPDDCRTIDRTLAGRSRALVNLSVLSEIVQEAKQSRAAPDKGRTDAGPMPDIDTPPQASTGLAIAYERVIQEQAGRIADLQAALDHERRQAQQINEALAREQTLRMLDTTTPKPTGFWAWLRHLGRQKMQGNTKDRVE